MSHRTRLALVLISLAAYPAAFLLLYTRMGAGWAAMGIVPVLLAGWLLGLKAGVLSGLCMLPLNTLLLTLVGYQPGGWGIALQSGGGIGIGLTTLIGAVIGRLHDLETQIERQLAERQSAESALQQQNEYFQALHTTTLGLMSRLNLNELLETMISRAGALMGTANGYVFLRAPGEEEIEMYVGVGAYSHLLGTRAKRGVGLAGTVWETGEPLAIGDYREWAERRPGRERDLLRAVVGVPLKSGSEVIGVLGLAYLEEGRTFGSQEIASLQRFAELAAIALDNARLYAVAQEQLAERARVEGELARRLRETLLLNRTIVAGASSPDPAFVLQTACDELAHTFAVPQVTAALLDESRANLLRLAEHRAVGRAPLPASEPLTGNTAAQIVLRSREAFVALEAQADPRLEEMRDSLRARRTSSLLGVPLVLREQAAGLLLLETEERHEFSADELALAGNVATALSQSLENALLLQELRRRAERERTTASIADRLHASTEVKSILRTAAQELRRATGSAQVSIRLTPPHEPRNAAERVITPGS